MQMTGMQITKDEILPRPLIATNLYSLWSDGLYCKNFKALMPKRLINVDIAMTSYIEFVYHYLPYAINIYRS